MDITVCIYYIVVGAGFLSCLILLSVTDCVRQDAWKCTLLIVWSFGSLICNKLFSKGKIASYDLFLTLQKVKPKETQIDWMMLQPVFQQAAIRKVFYIISRDEAAERNGKQRKASKYITFVVIFGICLCSQSNTGPTVVVLLQL